MINPLKLSVTKLTGTVIISFILLVFLAVSSGCNKDEDENEGGFTTSFTYSFKNDNQVVFENTSTGDYYSMRWDFGNGITETTTDKTKSFEIYYPYAGEYEVSLRLTNSSGSGTPVTQTVKINNDDTSIKLSFTATIDPDDPNTVLLKNTSEGDYDSFKWVYRSIEVENQEEYSAYFPYAGTYEVQLVVTKYSQEISTKQNVTIAQDDPDFVEGLVWAEEFEYTGLPDPDKWNMETGGDGWGNNELQYYTNTENNAIVENGVLKITARQESFGGRNYTSARITTQNKYDVQYGRIEARIKLPYGQGIWPAFWMLGDNFNTVGWPACGEIDIMEMVGGTDKDNTVHSTLHWDNNGSNADYGNSYTLPSGIFADDFHVFAIEWNQQKITAFVDDQQYFVIDITPAQLSEFHNNFFIILNVAVGGNWPGPPDGTTVFPQTMEVDYIRVYEN